MLPLKYFKINLTLIDKFLEFIIFTVMMLNLCGEHRDCHHLKF